MSAKQKHEALDELVAEAIENFGRCLSFAKQIGQPGLSNSTLEELLANINRDSQIAYNMCVYATRRNRDQQTNREKWTPLN